MKRCPLCKRTKGVHLFGKHSSTKDGLRCWCLSCSRKKSKESNIAFAERARDKYVRLKLAFVSAYGGKCYCCGETELAFLTLDHIYGRTKEERSRGTSMYLVAKKEGYPDKYRCACMNCNMAVKDGRICPHQRNK